MPEPLTQRQRAVYEFLVDEIRAKGVAPSLQDICDHFSLSSLASASKHLRKLQARGYIWRQRGRARSIELLWQAECCPTCGQPKPTTERAELMT